MRWPYVVFILCGLVVAVAIARSTESMRPKEPETNFSATEISIKSANENDRVVRLSDFKGKVVLMDFWATWCEPCRASIPEIVKLYTKNRSRGFEVMGIALERDNGKKLKSFSRDMKMTYPLGLLTDLESARPYTDGDIPQFVLIDRHGNVRWKPDPGYGAPLEQELEERVEKLLTEN